MRIQIQLFTIIILCYGSITWMALNGYVDAMNDRFSFAWFITLFFMTIGGLSLGAWLHGIFEYYFNSK